MTVIWRRFSPLKWIVLAVLCMPGAWTPVTLAQRSSVEISRLDLPDAPEMSDSPQRTGVSAAQRGNASLSATVVDSSGALVPGARVALIGKDGVEQQVISAGAEGEFIFAGLSAGSYRIVVASPGMGVSESPEFELGAGEKRAMGRIVLTVAKNRADVLVTVTQQELATEQVHAELQQRVFGILPNFYSNYDPNAVPLNAKQKFQLALRSTTDPVSFLTAGVSAGIGQATNLYGGYGQGAEGYGKRYGAAFGDDIIDRMIGSAILPTLFHQDPRYFYKGTGSRKERALYAVKSAFICKGDNGNWQFNYSHLIGNFAAAGISNAYYPEGDRGLGLTLRNGAVDTAGNVAANLIREFLLKGLTPKAPKDPPPGKP